MVLSNAERQRRYRERRKKLVRAAKLDGISTRNPSKMTNGERAAEIEELEKRLSLHPARLRIDAIKGQAFKEARAAERKARRGAAKEPEPDDDEDRSDSEEVIWSRGLLYRAEEALIQAAFEPEWAKYEIGNRHINAARQAADAWVRLANFLKKNSARPR